MNPEMTKFTAFKYKKGVGALLMLLAASGCSCGAEAKTTYMELADSAEYSIRSERWADAEQFLKRALRLQPAYKGNSMLLSNLGVVQTHLGKYGEALQSYDVGLAIGRDSVAILNNRAYTYLTMGDDESALSDLELSLSLDSIQEWPLKMSGLMWMKRSEAVKARPFFEALVRSYPDNASGPSGMGAVESAVGNYAEALVWYDKALAIAPSEEDWFYKVLLKCRLGKDSEAYDDIREALMLFPRSGNLYALQAYILKSRYQYAEAEQAKKIALDNGAEPQIVEELLGAEKKRR